MSVYIWSGNFRNANNSYEFLIFRLTNDTYSVLIQCSVKFKICLHFEILILIIFGQFGFHLNLKPTTLITNVFIQLPIENCEQLQSTFCSFILERKQKQLALPLRYYCWHCLSVEDEFTIGNQEKSEWANNNGGKTHESAQKRNFSFLLYSYSTIFFFHQQREFISSFELSAMKRLIFTTDEEIFSVDNKQYYFIFIFSGKLLHNS